MCKKNNLLVYSFVGILLLFLIVCAMDFGTAASNANTSSVASSSAGTGIGAGNGASSEINVSVAQTSRTEASSLISLIEYNLTMAKSYNYRMQQFDDMLSEMKQLYSVGAYDDVKMRYYDATSLLGLFYTENRQYIELGNILGFLENTYPEQDQKIVAIRQEYSTLYACIDTGDYYSCKSSISLMESNLTMLLKDLSENESESIKYILDIYNASDYYNDAGYYKGFKAMTAASAISAIQSMDIDNNTKPVMSLIITYYKMQDNSGNGRINKDYNYYYSLLLTINALKEAHSIKLSMDYIVTDIYYLEQNNLSTSRVWEEYYILLDLFYNGGYAGSGTGTSSGAGYSGSGNAAGYAAYSALAAKSEDMKKELDTIKRLFADLNETSNYIAGKESSGIDYTDAKYLLSLGMDEFSAENYEQSAQYLSDAKTSIDNTESKSTLKAFLYDMQSRFNIADYLKRNILRILLVSALIVVFSILAVFLISTKLLQLRLRRLCIEEEVVVSLLMRLQTGYYKDKDIDHDTYMSQYDSYQERLGDIRKELPILNARLEEKYSLIKRITSKFIFGKKGAEKNYTWKIGGKESNSKTPKSKKSGGRPAEVKSGMKISLLLFIFISASLLVSMILFNSGFASARLVQSSGASVSSGSTISSGPTGNILSDSARMILDKDYYQNDETVNIFLPNIKAINDAGGILSLEISLKEDPTYNLRYLGVVDTSVLFIPQRAGNYIIKLYVDNVSVDALNSLSDNSSGSNINSSGSNINGSGTMSTAHALAAEKSFIVYDTDTDKCRNYNTGDTINIQFKDYDAYKNSSPKDILMIFSYVNDAGKSSSEKWVYNQDVRDSITYVPSRVGKYSLFADGAYLDCFNVTGGGIEYHQQVIQYSGDSSNGGYTITDNVLNDTTLTDSSFIKTSQYASGASAASGMSGTYGASGFEQKFVDAKQQLALSVIGSDFYASENYSRKMNNRFENRSNTHGIILKDSKDNVINAYVVINDTTIVINDTNGANGVNGANGASSSNDIIEGDSYSVDDALAAETSMSGKNTDRKNTDIYVSHDTIKKLHFNNLKYGSNTTELYLEDVSSDRIRISELNKTRKLNTKTRKVISTFAIDPTGMNFTDGQITIQASGTELYKCREWNFTMQQCYGEWIKIADLKPGEFYNITLSPDDPAFSQTIQPDATAGIDSDLNQAAATTNTGTTTTMRVNNRNAQLIRTVISFDLSQIPSNAKVRYAGLQLYMTANTGVAFDTGVYRLTKGFNEAQVTWNVNQTGTNWATAGGDFASTLYGNISVSATINVWDEWNITRLVQEWVNGSSVNYGMILMNSSRSLNTTNTKTFASSDYAASANRPILIINYSIDNSGIFIYNETGISNYTISGTFNNTYFDNYTTYSVLLNYTANATNGTWTSIVFNGMNNVTWKSMRWSSLAIGELSNNRTTEPFGNGNVNMTNNVLLYHMNDTSGDVIDYSGTGNNGKNFGATYLGAGKIGYGMNFDGVSKFIHVNDNPTIDLAGTGTISVWIYKTGNSTNGGIVHKGDLLNWSDESVSLQYFPINITLYLRNASGSSITVTGPALVDNRWYHIVGTWNQTLAMLYVNGVLVANRTNNVTPMNSTGGLNIGCQINSSPYDAFNGTIDELAIWNASLSNADILSLYERGAVRLNLSARSCALSNCADANFTYIGSTSPQTMALPVNQYFQFQYQFSTDNVTQNPELYNVSIVYAKMPNSTLIAPSDGIYTNNNTINFTCNATDDTLLKSITLYWNYTGSWQSNSTTTVSGKTNKTSFILANLSDGAISWNCLVCDNSTTCSFAQANRTLTIDTQSPSITYASPTDGNNSYVARNWSIINVTLSEPAANCTLNFSGTSYNMSNISSTSWYLNKTLTPDGNYNYYVYCIDYANNTGKSTVQNITRDMTSPVVALNTPANTATVLQSQVLFNYTPSELNIVNCSLYGNFSGAFAYDQTNSTSITSGQQNNFTKSLPDGIYAWNVNCYDKAANNAFAPANYTLYVDTTPPSIYIESPANNTLINTTNNITFYYNVTDVMTGISSCSLIINGAINVTNNSITENTRQNFTLNIPNGKYNWSVNCTDNNGLKSSSLINNLTVFVPTVPKFTLITPLNNSGDSDMNVTISYNITGGNILNCSLILNGAVNQTNSSINTLQTQSFILSNLPIASYNWSIVCINDEPTIGTSALSYFGVIYSTNFSGLTTDFSSVDTRNITNLTIDSPGIGTIKYYGAMDLSNGTNINSIISIIGNTTGNSTGDSSGNALNTISVDSVSDNRFNRSAILTMYGLSYTASPIIYSNGVICSDCTVLNYTPSTGTLIFNVTHFTAYTTGVNANMTIWDASDPQGGSVQKFFGMQTKFYANYTNKSSGIAVIGIACNITFANSTSTIGTGIMSYNASSKLYEYNRSFSAYGFYLWNVTCNATSQGYELLKASDNIKIYNNATLSVINIKPTGNINVSRNRMFNYTLNISCVAGYCDNVAAILDPSSWWDSNWKYRKQITFSVGSSSTPNNYQIKLVLNSSNVGAGWNWSNECVGGTDSRIRFANITDNAQLGYWVHDCSIAGQNMTLWLKIDQNITAGTNYTLNMYYGNPAAANGSNGTAAFDFYDDFSGDLSKWTRHDITGIYPDIENGYMVAGGGITSGNYGHTTLGSDATYSGFLDGIIEGDIYLTTDSIAEIGFRGSYASNTGYKSRNDARAGQGLSHLMPPYAAWNFLPGCAVTGTPVSINTWMPFSITVKGSNFTEEVGGQTETCTDTTYSSAGEISLQNHYGSYTEYDNIRVRKYSSIIPAYTFGAEQSAGSKSIIPLYNGTAFTPFYTTTANPMGPANNSCLAGMNAGNSCQITWTINATGNANTIWFFYAIMNWTGIDMQSNQTNITIIDDTTPPQITNASLNATKINQTEKIILNVTIADATNVESATATMKYPNGTSRDYTLMQDPSLAGQWTIIFSDTNNSGVYNFTNIVAIDQAGNINNATYTNLTFTVTLSPPGNFNLLTPVNSTESTNLLPMLSWQQTTEATFSNYTLLVSTDNTFTTVLSRYMITPITNTSQNITYALDANTKYYWRVIAYDIFGASTNSTQDFTYITDMISPTVQLNNPADNTYITSSKTLFNYTPADSNTIKNCTLYGNFSGVWAQNSTNSSVLNGQPNYFNITLADGLYSWNVVCYDNSGNTGTSAFNNHIKVDTTPPSIQLISPSNNSYENKTNNKAFIVNATDAMSAISSCEIIMDGVIGQTQTGITNGVAFNFTRFVLNGNHTWSVNCTDTNGFEGSSQKYNITFNVIDTDPPLVTLSYPAQNDYVSGGNITFNYTPEDATGIGNCSIYLDGALNQTILSISNLAPNYANITGITQGTHQWNVTCYDNSTQRNKGTSSLNLFTVDMTNPAVALNNPSNAAASNTQAISFNYTPTDTNLDTCSLYGNFTGVFALDQTNTTPINSQPNTFQKTLSDGRYLWNVICIDKSGRIGYAPINYTILIDTTPPAYSNQTSNPATPATYNPAATYKFNMTWTDTNVVDKVLFESNFSGVMQNATAYTFGGGIYTVNITGVAAGNYIYKWNANDTLNNMNSTQAYGYTVMQASPILSLTLNSTSANISINEGSTINITAAATTPASGYIELYVTNTTTTVMINNGTSQISNNTLFANPGLYNITAYYPATQNYTSGSKTYYLTVNDTTPPNITMIYPANNATVGTSTIIFQYQVQDASAIQNCSIYINNTINKTDTGVIAGQLSTFSIDFTDGNYTWKIGCVDIYRNAANSTARNFTERHTTGMIFNINTTNMTHEQGEPILIKESAKDSYQNPLNADVKAAIIYLNTTITTTPWFDGSWKYRMPINITENNASNLTNYQVNITINTTGLIAQGKMNTTCSDIRFADSMASVISYWIAGGCNSSSTLIWLKMNLTASENKTIYMYYGNAQAQDGSNGTNVFDYYDDGNYLPNWTIAGTAGQTSAQGLPTPSYYAASVNGNYMYRNVSLTANKILDFNVRSDGLGGLFFLTDSTGAGQHFRAETRAGNNAGVGPAASWISWSVPSQTCAVISTNTWYNFSLVIGSSTSQAYINGAACGGAYTFTNNGPYIGLVGDALGGTYTTWWDNLRVRKYAAQIPTSTAIYVEQTILSWNYNTTSYIDGNFSYIFDSTSQPYGNYSVVALATSTGFYSAVNSTYFYLGPDTTAPLITLLAPTDMQHAGVGAFNFTYRPYDYNLKNCTLYIDINGTFTNISSTNSPSNNQTNTFTNISLGLESYKWNVKCYDTFGNSAFAASNYTLNITGPDLKVVDGNITFSSVELTEGKNITVYANITNAGLSAATTSSIMQFYYGDPSLGGIQIGQNITIQNMSVGEIRTINSTYSLRIGNNNIYVLVDALNTVNETNELNNKANGSITVGMYQYYYGNVTTNVLLGTSDDSLFLGKFNISSNTGYIFIANSKSVFSFTNLQALGLNKNNNTVGNDFSDLDANMNTTGYTDSVNNLWTGGTNIPLITLTYNISGKVINNVPAVYSTNNTNFETGILWDTADDASHNFQYDTTDNEDIVFATRQGIAKQGKYGVYNYEIKVPALLRSYKGSTDNVIFYYEIE